MRCTLHFGGVSGRSCSAATLYMTMMCLAILLLVSASAIVVSGQTPFRCTSPPAWEAHVHEYSSDSNFQRYGRLYYDAEGEQIAFYEEIFEGDEQTAAFNEFNFFKQNMTYRYNTFTQQCSRRPMNETFRKVGVTATAEFIDTFVIGTNAIEKFGVTVNIWGDNGGRNGRVIMEFVADDGDGDEDCIPISFTEFGGGPGTRGFHHQSFYNVVEGVNPDHFKLPEACQ